ncbi:MAG: T9SS type A sorting domain-containing protein, partial [Bacteroidota bacterium]
DISSLQFQINYNSDDFNFAGETIGDIPNATINVTEFSPGQLAVSISNIDTETGINIPNGISDIAFSFTAQSDNAELQASIDTDDGFMIVATRVGVVGSINVNVCSTAGPAGGGVTDFCLSRPQGPFIAGQQVEVDLITVNFNNISFLNLPIQIDDTQLAFEEISYVGPSATANGATAEIIDQGLRIFWLDWFNENGVFPDGTVLWTLAFTVLEDIDELPIEINPELGGLQASQTIDLDQPVPITICESSYINGQPANLQAEIFAGTGGCDEGIGSGPMPGWSIEVTDGGGLFNQTAVTNQGGVAYLNLPVGTFTYQWIPPVAPNDWNVCSPQTLEVTADDQIIFIEDQAETLGICSNTYVEISSSNLRPCFENNRFYVQYGNYGSAVAMDAFIDVYLPNQFTILSSNATYTVQSDGSLRIQLGDLAVGTIGSIYFEGQIDCDFPTGLSLCAAAQISPNLNDCLTGGGDFQGARLQATASCEDGQVVFEVENIGDGPSGMINFVVIEDVVIYMQDEEEYEPGQSNTRYFPANGSTWRIEYELPDGAPYLSRALAIEEGCGTSTGGSFTTGLVTALPLLDDDNWLDRYCLETTAAYDPNDKQAIPAGVGPDNLISPNEKLDYKIRFQNTGTDTAFTVIIRDTLAQGVYDLASLRPGISSHPYNLTIEDERFLTFTFANIMLPDSNVNEPASNGFVHFTIDQLPDLPDGTIISNRAGIYFDFNPPIITNYSQQTVMKGIISSVHQYNLAEGPVAVFPNPMNETLSFTHDNWPGRVTFQLLDVLGREILIRELNYSGQAIDLPEMSNGTYTYRLVTDDGLLQVGTLMKQ